MNATTLEPRRHDPPPDAATRSAIVEVLAELLLADLEREDGEQAGPGEGAPEKDAT